MRTGTLLALFLISATSCQPDRGVVSPEGDEDTVEPHPEHHVLVWVDPDSTLPEQEMLVGCEAWVGSGVGCDLVSDVEASDVQIYGDPAPCVPDANGSITLAYAGCCGPIVFFPECFKYQDGSWDSDALVTVASHEIGHQFGLWWHVPERCAGAPMHPTEGPVCGDAVMNAYYDRGTPLPNEIDALAFDIRDPTYSVIDEYNHHAHAYRSAQPPSCVYGTRP